MLRCELFDGAEFGLEANHIGLALGDLLDILPFLITLNPPEVLIRFRQLTVFDHLDGAVDQEPSVVADTEYFRRDPIAQKGQRFGE